MGQEDSSTRNSGGRGADTPASGLTNEPSLKSNLRRKRELLEAHQLRYGSRKVTWPDAHGKDLAHVQEFHSRYRFAHLHFCWFCLAFVYSLQSPLWLGGRGASP
ncbi:hypothetical protein CKAN_01805600 [Cinnamomum micranthum f. kanehirae]|uniref:Uncharacterized protein n=1 Tax=Cinnamomum micranthum f. kanehirae TaxID=337451 RepID=A0A3S3QQT3_9MAGN|nr:hypothetical protein CKAN_01805600 [Cinnamomum micranthum f. kanehirae]